MSLYRVAFSIAGVLIVAAAPADAQTLPQSVIDCASVAKDAARPITDMRGTADYRKHLCAVLTRRALESAVEKAREAR